MGTRPLKFPRLVHRSDGGQAISVIACGFTTTHAAIILGGPRIRRPTWAGRAAGGYAWALGLDIKKFFGSVTSRVRRDAVSRDIRDETTLVVAGWSNRGPCELNARYMEVIWGWHRAFDAQHDEHRPGC